MEGYEVAGIQVTTGEDRAEIEGEYEQYVEISNFEQCFEVT